MESRIPESVSLLNAYLERKFLPVTQETVVWRFTQGRLKPFYSISDYAALIATVGTSVVAWRYYQRPEDLETVRASVTPAVRIVGTSTDVRV